MRTARYCLLLACLFIATLSAYAGGVVIITMDHVAVTDAIPKVPDALRDLHPAIALMAARTALPQTNHCDAPGFLAINAGAMMRSVEPLPKTLLPDGKLDLSSYLRTTTKSAGSSPGLGALGEALHKHHLRSGAIGSVEALGMIMDSAGAADRCDPRVIQPTAADLARVRALLGAVDVTVVDISQMAGQNIAGALAWVRQLATELPPSTQVLICSPNAPDLHGVIWPSSWAVALHAPASSPHPDAMTAIYSPSTYQPGFIADTDIASTVLAWAGVNELVGNGQPCRLLTSTVSPRRMLLLASGLHERSRLRTPVLLGFVDVLAGAFVLLALAGHARKSRYAGQWRQVGRAIVVLAPACWVAYACTGILPTSPRALISEFALGIALAMIAALYFPQKRVFALWITAGLAILLCYAIVPYWHFFNLISYNVLKDSRYYGLGNPAAGLVLTGTLMLTIFGIVHPSRSVRALALLLPWVVAGWLFWARGAANFGMGITAAATAVAVLVVRFPAGHRLRWLLLLSLTALLMLAALIGYDVASSHHSHIGRLVLAIERNGMLPLVQVIGRKAAMAWNLLLISSWTYIIIAAFLAMGTHLALFRQWLATSLRARVLLAACLTGIVVSMLVKDSGVEPASIISACMVTSLLALHDLESPAEAPLSSLPITPSDSGHL